MCRLFCAETNWNPRSTQQHKRYECSHAGGRASNFSKAPPTSAYSGAGRPLGAPRGGAPYPAFAQSKVNSYTLW